MQLYRKTYNEEMRGPHSLVAFTGASVLWDVLARANSMDPEMIRKAALETDIPLGKTPVGWGMKFAPPGDRNMGTNARTYSAVMQWQEGGKFVTVYPKESAAGPIQYIPLRKWSERK
jgi:branched-chain amino acid transport system substrate-binding protein